MSGGLCSGTKCTYWSLFQSNLFPIPMQFCWNKTTIEGTVFKYLLKTSELLVMCCPLKFNNLIRLNTISLLKLSKLKYVKTRLLKTTLHGKGKFSSTLQTKHFTTWTQWLNSKNDYKQKSKTFHINLNPYQDWAFRVEVEGGAENTFPPEQLFYGWNFLMIPPYKYIIDPCKIQKIRS